MAAVSANLMHHQRHSKVSHEEQSEEESNDGSVHSGSREKLEDISSPEYKPTSPERRVDNPYSSNTSEPGKYTGSPDQSDRRSPNRCTNTPELLKSTPPQLNSSFSMHNMLKMKSERDSVSPPATTCSNPGVFSTEKLLESTPNYVRRLSPHLEEPDRRELVFNSENVSNFERSPKRISQNSCGYRDADYDHRNSSPNEEDDKLRRGGKGSDDMEEGNSCCSEDTVLSVGNEAQMGSFDNENRTSSTANSQIISPRSSPAPSPASSVAGHNIQNLSSFKHIQSHLSAISQLSQNLHGGQHLLLRPNPIAPNPLLFLNQNRMLFNPHLPIQPVVQQQLESLHQNSHSLSNSPTSINPGMSRLSPNEVSPNPSLSSNQLSPNSPGCDGKLNLMQNLTSFGVLAPQLGSSLRYYKQSHYGNQGMLPMPPNSQSLNSGFNMIGKSSQEERIDGIRKNSNAKPGHHDKLNFNIGNPSLMNPGGVNERLFGSNNPNITHNLNVDDERQHIILNHNGLKFSIDNILKADFGRRITDPLHKRSKSGSSKHKFAAAVLNPLASSGSLQTSKPVPLHHQNLKDNYGSGIKSGAFHQSKESNSSSYFQSKNPSSNLVQTTNLNNNSSTSSLRLSSERLNSEARVPIASELKSGSSLQNNLVTSSVSVAIPPNTEKPRPGADPIDLSKSESEGSSKGDGPMVWPAWVYCTRYSDRPSSGMFSPFS